jgi:GNAT superfamily N-acetyltransferase
MLPDCCEIALANQCDVDGILDLQERNLPHRGGTLSARLPRGWFEAAMAEMPVIVVRRHGRLVGYLASCPLAAAAEVPIIQAMLRVYRGAPDAYVYGPICVDEAERGRGLAGAMFEALRARLPGREGILFIRRDNPASLRAHEKMGMREVAGFTHGGAAFAVLSYVG